MARPRVPRVAAIAAVIARTVGLTISVVLLGNISYEAANWASQGKIYWLSFLAVAVAMIVDGWEIVGLMDYTRKVPRVHGGCLICEDILILCVAGPSIILILLSDLERDGSYGGYPWEAADFRTLILTFAVLAFRFLIFLWSSIDCCVNRHRAKASAPARRLELGLTTAEAAAIREAALVEDNTTKEPLSVVEHTNAVVRS